MVLMLIEPRTGQERYWSVESRGKLAAVIEREPEIVDWCRKDEENREALLEVAAEVQGGGKGLAEAMRRLFDEGERGGIGTEVFAEAVRQVLDNGEEVGEGIAERWRKAREEEERRHAEEERRREEEERLLTTPGRVMTVTLPGGAEMEMVWCPAGSFMMGSPANEEGRYNDERQHQVTLTKGFWMGKYPVTQAQWKSVMGSNSNPSRFKGDNLPVEWVSWDDCQAFCRKAGMRLPTEAEWEYACRAGSTTAYFWGNALNGDKANCDGNFPCGTTGEGPYKGKTTPVGSYLPNAWGLYDMHGNVWEWCADWYGDYPSGAVTDPTGPSSGSNRVGRGGSWYVYAMICRSASRSRYDPGTRNDSLGLRVALLPVQ